MSLLGIGPPELLVVLLVAFIFLGPERMIQAARMFGRLTREIRKMTAEVREMVDVDELINPSPPSQDGKTNPQPNTANKDLPANQQADEATADSSDATSDAAPVSYKSARELHREKMAEEAAELEAPASDQPVRSPEERS